MIFSAKNPIPRTSRFRFIRNALCCLLWLIVYSPDTLRAGETAPSFMMAEDARYLITLAGPGEPWYDPKLGGRVKFTFTVIDKVDNRQYAVYLNNMTAKITRLAIYRNKLIIMGEESTLHSSITSLIDLNLREEIDAFIGYGTKLSGTGRYIGFRKFYPPDTSEPAIMSDLILVYDMDATADANRMRGLDAYKNDAIGRMTEVGFPVFPEINASRKNYRVWVRRESSRNSVLPQGFFWFDGDRRFGFLDQQNGKYFIVVVDISNGPDHPAVREHEIDLRSLLRPEDQKDEALIREPGLIRIESIDKTAEERIRLHLVSRVALQNDQPEFSLTEMTPPPSVQANEIETEPKDYPVSGHSHED